MRIPLNENKNRNGGLYMKSIDEYSQIFDMIKNDFYYKNTDSGVLVTIPTADGKRDVSINSKDFWSIVSSRYRKRHGTLPDMPTIKNCVLSYRGDIIEQWKKVKNPNRYIKTRDNELWIDAGNKADAYYVVSENTFSLRLKAYKNFYKHSEKNSIPLPDLDNGDIDRIFKYCRVSENMKNIFIAYIVSLFIADIEHPCLVLTGEQGSGKTTVSTFIKALVDPVGNNQPCMFPNNIADLALMFQSNYLLAFDNLRTLTKKQSNILCSIITHIKEARRKLYTDSEMVRFDLCQPIILNGIHDIVKEPDMLSRSIVMNITKPTDKNSFAYDKVALMEGFMNDRAIILGGIIRILEDVLKNYKPNSVPRLGNDIRMSSFYDYGYYICESWKEGAGSEFCADYISLLENQLKDFKKNPDLLETLKCFLEENNSYWEGTMNELSRTLNNYIELVGEMHIKIPSAPNRLSREISNLRMELETAGITVEMSKTRNNSRYVRLSLEDTE